MVWTEVLRAMTNKVRCAIYTRKSTEEGLEQEFNSLDAQREACEAYIQSQRELGWKALPKQYDDGGISGGTLQRPALKDLLADIEAGQVDLVVVVSFVSVTQQFNTANSMGRLTLNMLLSFAQFEREVTAERIRDKIAASKRKGMWMGGLPPLGYDVRDKKLIINPDEAKIVQKLFDLYLEHKSVRKLKAEADRIGFRTKRRIYGDKVTGGQPFTRGHLYCLLHNPIYISWGSTMRSSTKIYGKKHNGFWLIKRPTGALRRM
jgi:site-specific DNA recombinase